MAKFFRAVLQHFAAIVVAFGLFCFLGFLLIVGLGVAMQPTPPTVPKGAVLVVDLGMAIYDSPGRVDPIEEIVDELQNTPKNRIALRRLLRGLDAAKDDESIAGLLLIGAFGQGDAMANTLATLTEVRAKLLEVRAAGKPIYAYSHTEGLAELFVKSVAETHWMDPVASFDYRGLAAQIAYLGGTFNRFGVEYQVVRAGKFKSAGEPFTSSEMSSETRESLGALLEDVWLSLRSPMAEDVPLDLAALDTLANEHPLVSAEIARERGLVDEVLYYDEMLQRLIDFAGYEPEGRTFKQIDLETYLDVRASPLPNLALLGGGDEIAVVYAEGTIVDGEGDNGTIGGDHYARLLRKLRKDDAVKAVVLRVNSPGGSATASELIAREVELTNAEKPVVVSMGGYAASGGYYISAPADTIFAQPTTVTGSIGVVAMLPNAEALAEDFEVNFETVETNRHGRLWSLFNSRSEEQLAILDRYIEHTYDLFLSRVENGRELPRATVEEVAQGREWSGVAAHRNGLVDRLGGLEAAITLAADRAGLGDDYMIVDLPREQTLEEIIANAFADAGLGRFLPAIRAAGPEAAQAAEALQFLRELNDRHHTYSYNPVRLTW
ncbi:MAG: signal peptide peptidase SppA [Opitutales bacterium]